MFDRVTADLLRAAPPLPDLNPNDLPALLTRHYAQLVSMRLRAETPIPEEDLQAVWPLEKIADVYELLASTLRDEEKKRSSAFVAATAHQILSRRGKQAPTDGVANENISHGITRESVPPDVSAALLFLVAQQYADANEASESIRVIDGDRYESKILTENIRDLTRGKLTTILKRASRWRSGQEANSSMQEQALGAILSTLNTGIEMLAADILATDYDHSHLTPFDTPQSLFKGIIALSRYTAPLKEIENISLLSLYAGPRHLATLLLAVAQALKHACISKVLPPPDCDTVFWSRWLKQKAEQQPYLWPNHQEAIAEKFYYSGKSAVLVLPTGAGKTTVSSLKIAGALGTGRRVIFLAPTHALVDQMTVDLQRIFPKDLFNISVGSDFDFAFIDEHRHSAKIETMTPERCLALLSFAPETFSDVGLLVFDECHLLSPEQNKPKRSLDGMLCLLAFNTVAPKADMLFLSAMLKNGKEFSDWISTLTGRDSLSINLLWKPARQARGVVVYDKNEIIEAKRRAEEIQNGQTRAKDSLCKPAKEQIQAPPYSLWGLQHNWINADNARCSWTKVLNSPVLLAGSLKGGGINITPNANHVAAQIAISAAKNSLKSIVFVNNKSHTTSTSKIISTELNQILPTPQEEENIWAALEAELGGLEYSMLHKGAIAVPHCSFMLRLERELAERSFMRDGGAQVIVATPTLAQGLNLPAHMAILAGDTRQNQSLKNGRGGREELCIHELLNAAARAGRAGHLANGIVLLIPEPVLSFDTKGKTIPSNVIKKLKSILPDNDQCLSITDPLELVLDRVSQGSIGDDLVIYAANRMAELRGDTDTIFDIRRSLSGFMAIQNNTQSDFDGKINKFIEIVQNALPETFEKNILILASHSGLPANVLSRFKRSIESIEQLPTTILGWIDWIFEWLEGDDEAMQVMLSDVGNTIMKVAGLNNASLSSEGLKRIIPGVHGWITGMPIVEIEKILRQGSGRTGKLGHCSSARELVNNIIPRGLVFSCGLLTQIVKQLSLSERQSMLRSKKVIESLSSALRLGYDTPEKVLYSKGFRATHCRVQIHKKYAESN